MTPATASTRLLLPAPLGPSSAVISPRGTVSVAPLTTWRPPRATDTASSTSASSISEDLLGAEVGTPDMLVCEHVGCRPQRDHPPEIEHGGGRTDRGDELHVMVDEDHLGVVALGDLPDELDQAFGLRLGKSRRGFVEQDHAWADDDALGNLDQAAFEHAQLAATPVGSPEADERQRLADTLVSCADLIGGHADIVVRRQCVDHLLLLKRPAQSPSRAAMRSHAEQARALRLDDAARGPDKAAEYVEQGRLAGTVGPH